MKSCSLSQNRNGVVCSGRPGGKEIKMTEYENSLKKQYEQQLQAGRNAVEGSVRQAEGALTQYAQQREDEARQA